jgi:tRNA (adenine22-N1)-methyltransferase
MQLSPRLKQILSLVQGRVLADIGTDHAYLPIAACLEGRVQRAIACDMGLGPLKNAQKNIARHHLQNKIETRLGDGLAPLAPGEADVITLSGMGGMNIVGILNAQAETARQADTLILQPQHDTVKLRQALHQACFDIFDECIINEGPHFYFILLAKPVAVAPLWNDTEYRFGKHLPQKNDKIWQAYLTDQRAKIEKYIHTVDAQKARTLKKYIHEVNALGG